jgi:putative ABC transport system ATP-binding protein
MKQLELIDLKYAYHAERFVLNEINVKFESKKFYAILGESGGGKTTLLSLLGGLDEATSGEIRLDGEALSKHNLLNYRKNEVAFIFQSYNLIDYLTAEENIRLATSDMPLKILEKVGISKEQASRNVLQLSGGQQQRVAIARALVSQSGILLADEPTGNLDEETATGIIELLQKSAHQLEKCVIVVTHSKELASHADVVFQLKNGKLQKIEI